MVSDVLLVDDLELWATLVRRALARVAPTLAFQWAPSIAAGLGAAPGVPFILLDLGLPKSPGHIELVRQFASFGGHVTVHSGWLDQMSAAEVDDLVGAGASGAVRKSGVGELDADLRAELARVFPVSVITAPLPPFSSEEGERDAPEEGRVVRVMPGTMQRLFELRARQQRRKAARGGDHGDDE